MIILKGKVQQHLKYRIHVLQYDIHLTLMVNMQKKPITVAQNGISMSRTEYIHATGKISQTIVSGH
jgi:HSP90 family molecular chaperone